MKPYNLKNLEAGLQEMASQVKGNEIVAIAGAEHLDPTTVRKYLKGIVTTPAIGKAILDRCRTIVIARQQKE
jgi:hypothetical protein